MFTCTRADEAIDCSESPRFYDLNRNFGSVEEHLDQYSQFENTDALDEGTPLPDDVAQEVA